MQIASRNINVTTQFATAAITSLSESFYRDSLRLALSIVARAAEFPLALSQVPQHSVGDRIGLQSAFGGRDFGVQRGFAGGLGRTFEGVACLPAMHGFLVAINTAAIKQPRRSAAFENRQRACAGPTQDCKPARGRNEIDASAGKYVANHAARKHLLAYRPRRKPRRFLIEFGAGIPLGVAALRSFVGAARYTGRGVAEDARRLCDGGRSR
jgi:hypothetical protein